jgi:hypothetical protein
MWPGTKNVTADCQVCLLGVQEKASLIGINLKTSNVLSLRAIPVPIPGFGKRPVIEEIPGLGNPQRCSAVDGRTAK